MAAMHSSETFNSFRRHLKTHLFQAAFSTPSSKLQHLRLTYVTTDQWHFINVLLTYLPTESIKTMSQ